MILLTVIFNRLKFPIDNMGSKTRLSTNCTMRQGNPTNLTTSRKINTRLAPYCADIQHCTIIVFHFIGLT